MSNPSPDSQAAGARPQPQYGQYATPEEQRARIEHPDASWALETGQSPDAPPQAQTHAWSIEPTAAAPAVTPARNVDRVVTLALLVVGAFNVALTAISYFNLPALANQAMKLIGIPGEFTNVESAQLWGPIAAVVLIAGFVLTALFAWRSVRRGRLSWWIPLVGAVVTYLAVYSCLAVPILSDPAFVAYSISLS